MLLESLHCTTDLQSKGRVKAARVCIDQTRKDTLRVGTVDPARGITKASWLGRSLLECSAGSLSVDQCDSQIGAALDRIHPGIDGLGSTPLAFTRSAERDRLCDILEPFSWRSVSLSHFSPP